MGSTKAMFSDLSGTIFNAGEGIELRAKIAGENGDEPKHVKLDVLASDELVDDKGKPLTITALLAAGQEVKPRGRKPAEAEPAAA